MRYLRATIVFQEIPDEVSLAIEITGCPNHCPGCHSPELQEVRGSEITPELLTHWEQTQGRYITTYLFMGGDHYKDELIQLLGWAHQQGKLTGLYSGAAGMDPDIAAHLDYYKTGPYEEARGPITQPGTNQQLWKRVGREWVDITSRMQK